MSPDADGQWLTAHGLDVHVSTDRSAQFAGVARFEETHGVVIALETDGRKIQAAAAQRCAGGACLAAQLAGRADVHARPALAAALVGDVKWARNPAMRTAPGEPDGARHHLLLADAHAQPALDAVLMLDFVVAALADAVLAGQVLDGLRLRAD